MQMHAIMGIWEYFMAQFCPLFVQAHKSPRTCMPEKKDHVSVPALTDYFPGRFHLNGLCGFVLDLA